MSMQEVEFYGPGEMPEYVRPADLIFRKGTEPLSRLIRFTTRSDKSHVAIYRGRGKMIHAVQRGVVVDPFEKYRDSSFYLVRCPMSNEDRAQVVDWLDWAVGEGWRYDTATFLGMVLFWATGGKLMISAGAKAAICSGLAADSLRAANYKFPKTPAFMTPIDLFKFLTRDVPSCVPGDSGV